MERISSLIPTWILEGKKDLDDPRSIRDWLKYNIQKTLQNVFNKQMQTKRSRKKLLNKDFQDAYLMFQNDRSQENLATLNL